MSGEETKILVVLDEPTQSLRSPVQELLTFAHSLGKLQVAALGEVPGAVQEELNEFAVSELYQANLPADASASLTSVAAAALAEVVAAAESEIVLLTSSFANKEVAAVLSYQLAAGLVLDTVTVGKVDGKVVGFKRVFAGSWDIDCAVQTEKAVMTVRANSVIPQKAETPSSLVVKEVPVTLPPSATRVVLKSRTTHSAIAGQNNRPKLAEAAYVVAGGRGTFGDFSQVEELADAIGGAVGATRDAVDEGWIEHDAQIGQTGVTIAPRVYIGAGISGAPHHRGGMQASGVIIGVNVDQDAPIFEIADFGVVGELSEVLPQAAEIIRAHKENQG